MNRITRDSLSVKNLRDYEMQKKISNERIQSTMDLMIFAETFYKMNTDQDEKYQKYYVQKDLSKHTFWSEDAEYWQEVITHQIRLDLNVNVEDHRRDSDMSDQFI